MSPEQATGDVVDHRSDIYSLGVILYEMVTGVLPFRANFGELVVQLLTVEPRPPCELDLPHTIPQPLEQLILDMLAKKASQRPQSMREVEDRLRAIQAELMPFVDDPVSARLRRATDRTPTFPSPSQDTIRKPSTSTSADPAIAPRANREANVSASRVRRSPRSLALVGTRFPTHEPRTPRRSSFRLSRWLSRSLRWRPPITKPRSDRRSRDPIPVDPGGCDRTRVWIQPGARRDAILLPVPA